MPARQTIATATDNLPVALDGDTDLEGFPALAGNPERTYTRQDRTLLVFIIHTIYYSDSVQYRQSETSLFITGSPTISQWFSQSHIESAARLRNNMPPTNSA